MNITVCLPEELVERIDKLAKDDVRSRSYMVKKLILRALSDSKRETNKEGDMS